MHLTKSNILISLESQAPEEQRTFLENVLLDIDIKQPTQAIEKQIEYNKLYVFVEDFLSQLDLDQSSYEDSFLLDL